MRYENIDFTASPNLKRLVVLRSVILLFALIGISLTEMVLHIHLPLIWLLVPAAITTLSNFWVWRSVVIGRETSETGFFVQILIDVFSLGLLLYLTGGSTNPFVFLLLLPLIIAAAVLHERFAWGVALVTIACYTLLMFTHLPLHYDSSGQHHAFNMHVSGMWMGFVFSAVIIAFFVVRMRNALREREDALAQAREQSLRDERLVALGTLAAGTAHELGTPLSTIAVVIKEMQREYKNDSELNANITLIRQQIARCKEALATLSSSAGQLKAESGDAQTIDAFILGVLSDWVSMRPGVKFKENIQKSEHSPKIIVDQTFSQALLNILNNAADASLEEVIINVSWDDVQMRIDVLDSGSGFAKELAGNLGYKIQTTKGEQGLGMGLFIADSVIKRLNGELRLFNLEQGGACVRMTIPLSGIECER